MIVEVDIPARALYLRVADGRVADSVELADAVVADIDESGRLLGIEFIRLNRFAPFLTTHPDVVTLPARLTYLSVDRGKTWHVEADAPEPATNGDQPVDAARMNATFLAEIVADPQLVDRIVEGETIVLRLASTPS